MGRPPKPIALHRAEGTYRADRHAGRGVDAPAGAPAKPTWLKGIASEVWDETVAELSAIPGLLSPVDGPALALYCDAWRIYRENMIGTTAVCRSQAKGALDTILRLGAKFGLTPSARAGLNITPTAGIPRVRRRQGPE